MGDGIQLKSKFLIGVASQDDSVISVLRCSFGDHSLVLKPLSSVPEVQKFLDQSLISKTILVLPLQLQGRSMEPIFDDLLKERNPQVAGLVLLGDGNSFYQVFSFYFEKFRAQNFPFYGFQKTAGLDSLPELLRRMMGDDFSLPPGWVASPDFQYLREKQNLKFLHAQHPGKILKSARTALGLTQKQLVDAAKKMGVPMTIQRYSKIETDRGGGRQIGATDWYYLCQLLEIHTESISYGYEPSIHLQRVRYAIEKGTYRLPLTKVILKNLNQTDLQVFAEPTLQKKQSQK